MKLCISEKEANYLWLAINLLILKDKEENAEGIDAKIGKNLISRLHKLLTKQKKTKRERT